MKISYHFLGEGIILFLIVLPIFKYAYYWVPYWTYFISLIFITLAFTLFALFTTRYIWYVITAPILFLIYTYLLEFPMLLSAIIALILTWRYVSLRQIYDLENERLYLHWTTFLVLISILFFKENITIIFLIIQFFILIAGYLINHTLLMEQDKQKQFSFHIGKLLVFISFFVGVCLILLQLFGIPTLFILWDVVIVSLWNGLTIIMAYVGSIIMYGIEYILKLLPDYGNEVVEVSSAEFGEENEDLFDFSAVESNQPYLSWLFAAFILGFILYRVLKVIRKKFNHEQMEESQVVTYHPIKNTEIKESLFKRLTNRFSSQPKDPVRKAIYQFERKTEKLQQGRKPYETLQEWFQRIDLEADIYTYEKVRYGGGQSEGTDVQKLTKQLNDWFEK